MAEKLHGYAPTTTHAAWGAGDPHLLISRNDEDRSVLHLGAETVTMPPLARLPPACAAYAVRAAWTPLFAPAMPASAD